MKHKKANKKRGFTLVELLVVIAILAVLATVSIVGYASFSKKAKISNDKSLITQLNLALQADEVLDGKANTPTEALAIVEESGYIVPKLTPTTTNYDIVWNQNDNQFALLDENGKVVFGKLSEKAYENWAFIDDYNDSLIQKHLFSAYINDNYSGFEFNDLKAGIDLGNNKTISKVTYTNTSSLESKAIIIRTNSAITDVEIDATKDTINHYGAAGIVNIEAIGSNSYHEFGSTSIVTLKEGHLVVENNGFISLLDPTSAVDSNKISCVNNGVIVKIKEESNKPTITPTGKGQTNIGDGTTINVGNADTLINLAYASNNGTSFAQLEISLTNDIDLTNKIWIPFGIDSNNKAFTGCKLFNGNSHKITGLKTDGKDMKGFESKGQTTIIPAGLIGYLKGNVAFKDLTIEVNINNEEKGGVGAFIGVITGNGISNATFENCIAKGTIKGVDKLGGFIGSTYSNENDAKAQSINMKNCTNEVNVIAAGSPNSARIGGFIGTLAFTGKSVFENCTNNGNITNEVNLDTIDCVVGGFAGKMNIDYDLTVTNFTNNGTLTCKNDNIRDEIASGNNINNITQKATFNGKHLKVNENKLFDLAE